jgi:hypothetical protein
LLSFGFQVLTRYHRPPDIACPDMTKAPFEFVDVAVPWYVDGGSALELIDLRRVVISNISFNIAVRVSVDVVDIANAAKAECEVW